jgi:trans-aconitate methyltransferase
MPQTWDPERYAKNARFVSDLGQPVVELLAPRPGERILDLGCGDGALTAKLAALSCDVIGVDASPLQIAAARKRGLDAWVMSADALNYESEFDAVFSNAVLHWVRRADDAIACVWRALRPGGRFVGEMGGVGCVAMIRTALVSALNRRGIDGQAADPWYFPTPEDYRARLERRGFRVDYIELIPRPTPLPGDVSGWLETFAESFITKLPAGERATFIEEVRQVLAPRLRDANGTWIADYTRVRFAAIKPAA